MKKLSVRFQNAILRLRKNHYSLIKRYKALGFILAFAIVGSIILVITHASSPTVSVEPENGSLLGQASLCTDASASNGSCVKFGGGYSFDYPRTMSYRMLNNEANITCNMTDDAFKAAIQADNLDKYTEVTADNYGSCDHDNAEQFKRLYPNTLVINYENAEGLTPKNVPNTWPGYYLMMNRDRVTGSSPPVASATAITVAHPDRFTAGDYALMYESTTIGQGVTDPYGNAEYIYVVSVDSANSTLHVVRNVECPLISCDSSLKGVYPTAGNGATFTTLPYVAALADSSTTASYTNANGIHFAYNISDTAPANPANGERANQWLADFFVNGFAADTNCPGGGSGTCTNPTLDGMEFDVASWLPHGQNFNGNIKNFDCNGDGVIDYCDDNLGSSSQINSYGLGYEAFIHNVKEGLKKYNTTGSSPKIVMGDDGFRAIGDANGAEFESFPPFDNYPTSSAALADLQYFLDNSQSPQMSYAFTKDDTINYPGLLGATGCANAGVDSINVPVCRNGSNRYGLAASLVTGSFHAYADEAGFSDLTGWDEDGITNTATTGLHPGYLGQPKGPEIRLPARYTSADLVSNGDFETDTSGWALNPSPLVSPNAAGLSRDTSSGAPNSGSASMKASVTGISPDPTNPSAINLNTQLSAGLSKTADYTVTFWAKADSTLQTDGVHEVTIKLAGASVQTFKLGKTWRQYTLDMAPTSTISHANAILSIQLGAEIGDYWFDGLSVFQGTDGIITREYDNGIVVLNDSAYAQSSIPLSGAGSLGYRHINGVQDRSVNDGSNVGATLPSIGAKDGVILLRN